MQAIFRMWHLEKTLGPKLEIGPDSDSIGALVGQAACLANTTV